MAEAPTSCLVRRPFLSMAAARRLAPRRPVHLPAPAGAPCLSQTAASFTSFRCPSSQHLARLHLRARSAAARRPGASSSSCLNCLLLNLHAPLDPDPHREWRAIMSFSDRPNRGFFKLGRP